MVWPSGVERATCRVATVPLPPAARFSITTCWPSDLLMRSPTIRAMMSLVPPGGSGTTSVIGRLGYGCAEAPEAAAMAAMAIAIVTYALDMGPFP